MAFSYAPFQGNGRLQLAAENRPPLKRGERGEAVRLLQAALVQLDFRLPRSTRPDGTLDGVYGGEVAGKIVEFQRRNRLSVDGQAGRNTLGAIDSLLGGGRSMPAPEATPGPTTLDIGLLADDVYHPGRLLGQSQWRVEAPFDSATTGFAAAIYRLGETEHSVISYRGTEPSQRADIVNDIMMIPRTGAGTGARVLDAILDGYNLDAAVERLGVVPVLGRVLDSTLSYAQNHPKLSRYLNRVPAQTRLALSYFDAAPSRPRFVTGHSLGGALAKAVAMHRGIPCVAFNSPYMGDLIGTTPTTSACVLSINARLDPLSMATRTAGNLSHGGDIVVNTPPPLREINRLIMQRRNRDPAFPWWTQISPAFYIANKLSSTARDYELVWDLLCTMAGHYHSITNLREAMRNQARFLLPLQPDFENLF